MSSSGEASLPMSGNGSSASPAPIGIIGGSGISDLPNFLIEREVECETAYGKASAPVIVGKANGIPVAFLPRHGKGHAIPPHRIPYKANLAALKSFGVRHVYGTCIVGSLKEEIAPGTFVVPDQFINLTWGRDDTFDADQRIIHLPMATPYCRTLSEAAGDTLHALGEKVRRTGTVVVTQGPRFSTMAEGTMYELWGGDIVNMTQYPEVYFARELGLCYAAIASVTDHDPHLRAAEVSMEAMGTAAFEKVLQVFRRNVEMTRAALVQLIQSPQTCSCAEMQVRTYYEAS